MRLLGGLIAVLVLAGCDPDECVFDCAAKCNGSPTHACVEACEAQCDDAD